MNPINDLLMHLSAAVVNRFKTMGESLQPFSQEQVDAIRDGVTLNLIARLREIEQARDTDLRQAERCESALEVTKSFRSNLN